MMVKTEKWRSDIYVYFNVNFNVFFLNKNLHLLVSELYIYQMHGATIKKTCTCFVLDYAAACCHTTA